MASKKFRKRKSSSKITFGQKSGRFMVYLIALVMLTSAFGYLNSRQPQVSNPKGGIDEGIQRVSYTSRPLSNATVPVKVVSALDEYIVLPSESMSRTAFQNLLYDLENHSIDGVLDIRVEQSSAYLLFRIRVEDGINQSRFVSQIENTFLDSTLYRGYNVSLPESIGWSGANLIGSIDLKSGDFVSVFLLEDEDEQGVSRITAFQKNRLSVGENTTGEVVGVVGYTVTGYVGDDDYLPLNKTLVGFGNYTLTPLQETGNVSANSTSFEPSTFTLNLPPQVDINSVTTILGESGAFGMSSNKVGFAKIPPQILLNGIILPVQMAEKHPVELNAETVVGDVINISLNVMDIGEQTIVYGGKEI